MAKRDDLRDGEITAIIVPVQALDRHARTVDTDDIVRIDLSAAPCGRRGARLYHQQGVTGNLISRRALTDATDVQMTGQDEVDAMLRKLSHRHPGTPEKAMASAYIWHTEGMMGDDDPSYARPRFCQPRTGSVENTGRARASSLSDFPETKSSVDLSVEITQRLKSQRVACSRPLLRSFGRALEIRNAPCFTAKPK